MKIFPVVMDENADLKYGDVFTINPDKSAANWQMVKGRVFIAVPPDCDSRSGRKIWGKVIAKAEKEYPKAA